MSIIYLKAEGVYFLREYLTRTVEAGPDIYSGAYMHADLGVGPSFKGEWTKFNMYSVTLYSISSFLLHHLGE